MAQPHGKRGRVRRALRAVWLGLCGLLGLAMLLVAGLFVSLRFARVRAYVVSRVNTGLADSFKGRVTLRGLQSVGLTGVGAADAEVFDPDGHRVLDVRGLDVRLSVPTLLWAVLSHRSRPLTIRLDSVAVRHVDATLIDDGTGAPTLADTFEPKTPSPPSAGPATIVVIDRLTLAHVWAHGTLGTALDVELRDALVSLRSDALETALIIKSVRVQARGLPNGVDPSGNLTGSLHAPTAPEKPLAARAHYQGSAAGIPVLLDASYADAKLSASLQASNIPSAAVAVQVPGLTLRSPATLTASAEGRLPNLHGDFALGLGAARVEGDFDLSLQADLSAKATVRAHHLDLAELAENAPPSSLDFALHAGLTMPKSGPLTGDFQLTGEPSAIAGQALPPLSMSGVFSNDDRAQRSRVDAHGEIDEPGAHTGLDATLQRAEHGSVEFRTATTLREPPRLKKLARGLSVRGTLRTQGSYQIESQDLNATVQADLSDLSQTSNRIARAALRGTVSGVLPRPNVELRVDLKDAQLAGQRIPDAELAVRGTLARVALSAELSTVAPQRHVQVSAIVVNQRGVSLDHPSLNLRQGNTDLKLSAARVEIVNGRTRLDGLHLEGAGTADASLVYGPTLESVSLQTDELDVARLWRLLDPSTPLQAGVATIAVRYEKGAASPRATVKAEISNLVFTRVAGGSVNADLTLADGRLDGSARADLKHLGRLHVELEELRGIDLTKPNPEQATGKLTVDGEMRLRDLDELFHNSLPIARARGTISYDLGVERQHSGPGLPTFHAHVSTKNLQLATARESKTNLTTKQEALDAAPIAIKGLDVNFDLKHAETGETELALSVKDELGPLGALSVSGRASPHLATIGRELAQNWRQTPVSVRLTLPPRALEELPIQVRPAGVRGILSGEFDYDGTLDAPQLKTSGKLDHYRMAETANAGLDLAWQGDYNGSRGRLSASARTGSRDVGKADIEFETVVAAWLERHRSVAPALDANARVDFEGFPIALLPGTETSLVGGSLSGKVELKHFGKDASLDATLEAKPLNVGDAKIGGLQVEVQALNSKAQLSLRVEDQRGLTTALAHSGLDWGARLVPIVTLPADAAFSAKGLRLAAFQPLLTSIFGELDGSLTGDLNAHFRGGPPELDGRMDLEDGTVQIASIGQRFDQIKARFSLNSGTAKVEQLSAHATSGKLSLTGEAHFAGLDLTDANAKVRITKKDQVALSVAGTGIGDAWGSIDLTLHPATAERSSLLAVNIPELHVHIPDTGSQDVQDLDPAKHVRVGTNQRAGDFVTLPLQPLTDSEPTKNERPMLVDLSLGEQIWISHGEDAKVQLSGHTRVTLGDPATMTGQINLRGGSLDVSGKKFEVETGTVTFAGEPGNPVIVATARWDAPDDEQHRVYADYTGTVRNGKIVLRSEPTLTQDQILSLLVVGSPDGSLGGTSGGSAAGTAVGAVGGAATQGLNKALSNISSLDVSTRVDTSTGSARPELVVQISPKVSARLTRALGAPAPGQPPDLTFLTFDFRIRSRWSLSALVGDRGESGLDLIWRRSY